MAKRGLFVGRFQPLHNGHLNSIRYCLDRLDLLIIAIGSADKSFEPRNPFTAGERIEFIRETICGEINEKALQKTVLVPVPDIGMHRLWTHSVDSLVPRYETVFTNDQFTTLLFKERGVEVVQPELINREKLSATEVRHRIANNRNWMELVSGETAKIIEEIAGVERIRAIAKTDMQNKHGK